GRGSRTGQGWCFHGNPSFPVNRGQTAAGCNETASTAARITSTTACGCEIITTCEASISTVSAFARAAMVRRTSVPTALSPVGTTAQVGSDCQAGAVVG